MEPTSNPFTSREVRWYLEGIRNDHESPVSRFRESSPYERHPSAGEPDVYLLIPASRDMGIK
jgi:hypothetical protein